MGEGGADEGVERETLKGARGGMAEQTGSHDGKGSGQLSAARGEGRAHEVGNKQLMAEELTALTVGDHQRLEDLQEHGKEWRKDHVKHAAEVGGGELTFALDSCAKVWERRVNITIAVQGVSSEAAQTGSGSWSAKGRGSTERRGQGDADREVFESNRRSTARRVRQTFVG